MRRDHAPRTWEASCYLRPVPQPAAQPREDIFPTLRDPEAQARFEWDGFAVLPVLEPDEARDLSRRVLTILPPDPGPFFGLFRNDPPVLRKQVDRLIRGALERRVAELFVDHDFWSAAVLVKQQGEAGSVDLHTDWNMVDETRYRSGVVWLALGDTTAANGGLYVVPGTNRLDVPIQGRVGHSPFDAPPVREAIRSRTVQADVPIGHAAIWDNRLLHGSGPNKGTEWRIAAALGFKPRAAQLYYHHRTADGTTHRYAIEREFFLDYDPFSTPDATEPHVLSDDVVEDRAWELTTDALTGLGPIAGASVASRAPTRLRWLPGRRAEARRGTRAGGGPARS